MDMNKNIVDKYRNMKMANKYLLGEIKNSGEESMTFDLAIQECKVIDRFDMLFEIVEQRAKYRKKNIVKPIKPIKPKKTPKQRG